MSTQTVSSRQLLPRQVSSYDDPPYDNVFGHSRPGRLSRPRILEIILEWRRRMRSRRELAALSSLELKDIGYPARAALEISKPFWRA